MDSVVDSSGEVVYETGTDVERDLDVDPAYIDAVIKGMHEVVAYDDGTAYDSFKDFEYQDRIAGKTGTGKTSDIDLENNGWFVCLAPYGEGKPEIAIVVFLSHGYSGSSSTATAKDFLQYYFDSQKHQEEETPKPSEGSMVS